MLLFNILYSSHFLLSDLIWKNKNFLISLYITLEEFRKLTEDVPDETSIVIRDCPTEFSLEEKDISYHAVGDILIIDF